MFFYFQVDCKSGNTNESLVFNKFSYGAGGQSEDINGSGDYGDDEDDDAVQDLEKQSDMHKCFRSRMTYPVVWSPRHMRAVNGKGHHLDDDSCTPSIIKVMIKAEEAKIIIKQLTHPYFLKS